jgi:hypothetical protein
MPKSEARRQTPTRERPEFIGWVLHDANEADPQRSSEIDI